MIGIIINTLSIVIGGILGAFLSHRLSGAFTEKLNEVFGICAMGMGISSVILMENMPAIILAIVAGTSLGLAFHFGKALSAGAMLLQRPISALVKKQDSPAQTLEAYQSLLVTAVVLFCASGSGIYGSLDAGMTGEITILLSKSILDLFTAVVFACSLGAVVSVIAVPQMIIYSALFLLAKVIFPLTTPAMIADFKACGGLLLIATGLRMAKIKNFAVADMIPSMILVMPLSAVWANYVIPIL